MARRIFCSFSGGESSAEMTIRVKERLRPDDEMLVLFANTGQEDERTLVFVDRCDREYSFNTVWLESVVHPQHRKGTTHRVVTFETATRDSSLFEAMSSKSGLPNVRFPHCTRELKMRPIESYLRSIGWAPGSYVTACGIRADEMDRIHPSARARGYVYPLAQANVCKADVHRAWDARPFQLGIKEQEGNCTWCWKKTLRKHLTLAVERPDVFDGPRYLERHYANAGPASGAQRIFRESRTVDDIFAIAAKGFEPFVSRRGEADPVLFDMTQWDDLDLGGACGESCEPYGDEASPELEEVA